MNLLQSVLMAAVFVIPTPAIASTTPVVESLPPIMAWCESHNNPRAKNAYSTASGRFQFLSGSWYYYGKQLWGDEFYDKSVWDYDDSTELALYVYKKNGVKDWSASSSCWMKPTNGG